MHSDMVIMTRAILLPLTHMEEWERSPKATAKPSICRDPPRARTKRYFKSKKLMGSCLELDSGTT